jgi:pimeloyl-ACP methyl ester carboxylesterase
MGLYFKETGYQNAETIIFLHGGAMAGWVWEKQVKEFSDYHCIIPDLPEHGKSIDVKPFSINESAEMIADIIHDHTSNGKAHLVGISLGAQIIIQILSKTPELIDHAIISGTLVNKISNMEALLKLLDYTIEVYKPVKNKDFLIKANMRTYNMPKILFDEFKESTILIKNDSLNRVLKESTIFKLPEGLEKIEVPVLVITGEKDYKIIKESADVLLNSLQLSESYKAHKVGHLWNLEDPIQFNRVIRRWLTNNSVKDDSSTN